MDTTATVADQPTGSTAIAVPAEGLRVVFDGDYFTISDGRNTEVFEMDLDGNVAPGRIAVDYSTALTPQDLAIAIRDAIANSGLNLTPSLVGDSLVFLDLPVSGSAVINSSRLSVVGVARTISDGQTLTITHEGVTQSFEFTRDSAVTPGNIPVNFAITDTPSEIGQRLVSAISASTLGLSPLLVGDGSIALRGNTNTIVDTSNAPDLGLSGEPGVTSSTELNLFGPLLLQVPGAAVVPDGSTFTVTGNGRTVVFEFDIDSSGPTQPANVVVPYSALSSANDIATAVANAIAGAGLGLQPTVLGGGLVQVGHVPLTTVDVRATGMTTSQGLVGDGEHFTISNGTNSVTFEFDDVSLGNGTTLGRTPILYSSTSSVASIIQTMQAVINGAGLGLNTTVEGTTLKLNDTPTYSIDTDNAPTIQKSGIPGGATAVSFFADASFTSEDMKRSIVEAINAARNTTLSASERGGPTLFVSGAVSISSEVDSFFIRGVSDLSGNFLKPNRVNGETQFTILMPGVLLDFGDAPDPLNTTLGRYPTLFANDGARHVVGTTALLGAGITADTDGQPSDVADADTMDDGVVFGAILETPGVFNRNLFTPVTVTLSTPGYVDGWIDFNADGDWDDPGEKVFDSIRFTADTLTQTFMVTVPATAPIPSGATQAVARFRSSSAGALLPTGLAVDGEIEDYMITIVPGVPPQAVNDTYNMNEDSFLLTTDAAGTTTPNFASDDGVAANDIDPDSSNLSVRLVDAPQRAQLFELFSDGTFAYQPLPDFFGTDTFTYQVNDGVLGSTTIGTVTIVVNPVNDAPVAQDDTIDLDEDQVLDIPTSDVLVNDNAGNAFENGQTITVTGVSQVSAEGGSVTLSGGRIIYTPAEDFSGIDTFTYTITDNGITSGLAAPLSATATVTVMVADRNDAPITGGDELDAVEDTAATITVAELLANDSVGPAAEIAAGQSLEFVRVIPTSENGGTVSVANGTVTYTPAADFVGTDFIYYEVRDNGLSGGVADPRTSVGTVTVTVTNVNDAPRVVTSLGTQTAAEDASAPVIDLNNYFFDPDVASSGDQLVFSIVSNSNSTLVSPSVNSNQLILELAADRNGQSVVVVRATDGSGQSITNTLTLNVTPVNDAPRLALPLPDLNVNEDAVIPGIALSPQYFFDPDVELNGDSLTFRIVSNGNPLLVTPTISGNILNLSLLANQFGSSLITISATDSTGQSISDQFNLVVASVNDVPIAVADSYTVAQGTTLTTTDPRGLVGNANDDGVLANDTDVEGSTLTAVLVNGPAFATSFTLNPNGTFEYVHDGASRTEDSFTYRASDGNGQSLVTRVTINISAPPPPLHQNPVLNPDVNADGFVSPIDVLLIVNFINQNGGGAPVAGLPAPPPFRDVNGDNFISPLDILRVVNYINAQRAEMEGEGEAGWNESLVVSSGLGYDLGSLYTPEVVVGSKENVRIGMRQLPEGVVVGPVQPAFIAVLDELDSGDQLFETVDWSSPANDSQDDLPVDLALSSLFASLDDSDLGSDDQNTE